MMALRVFRLMSDLKMAVEVGLVVGTIPQMMPIGSAIVMVPKVSSSDRTPQVFRLYKRCKCIRKQSGFDHFVFNDAHAGFGYGHLARGIRASAAARAAARKILSTCS